ncbi:MBL fold metallo-hydrolase [Butyrivibrio sp. CB08]|uniref:MBL fold metallo-hydrolase n=1 Tax=Butyrivibrio sp. CB08 TaxID=2364879 RepID=UPI000EAA87A5|nr:MBL fold metallo-hydrolase [Butyrivibrio sp. CB08]RKM62401.1 MBL fold metallo-hydrolase [Butyrivibrio sp. CB08]
MAETKVGMFTLGMVGTNCYFVFKEDETDAEGNRHCIFFDPADREARIFEALKENQIVVDLILLTHGHFDHIGGAAELKKLTGAKLGCLKEEEAICKDPYLNLGNSYGMDLSVSPDILYRDGEEITAAGLKCRVLKTPGHTSGSCCYYFEDDNILISGDTLFEESVGRTDFPTSSTSDLIRSVKEKIFVLPDETYVYPGHGEMTTVGHEKQYNPFII